MRKRRRGRFLSRKSFADLPPERMIGFYLARLPGKLSQNKSDPLTSRQPYQLTEIDGLSRNQLRRQARNI